MALGIWLGAAPAEAQFVCVGNATGAALPGGTANGGGGVASGQGSTACGRSTATGAESSAYGANSTASGDASSAFGAFSTASEHSSSAFGTFSRAIGEESSAFGDTSRASGTKSSAFGYASDAAGAFSSAFGAGATAAYANSSAFGTGAVTTRADQLALGKSDSTYTLGGVASEASKTAQGAPAKIVTTNEAGDLAAHTATELGLASQADVASLQSKLNGTSVAIGLLAGEGTTGSENVAVGSGAGRSLSGNNNIAIGKDAGWFQGGSDNIFMGTNAGINSVHTGSGMVAIGNATDVRGDRAVAIGNTTGASTNGVAVGAGASAGVGSTAIGTGANAVHQGSTAIGAGATTTRVNQVAVGKSDSTYTLGGVTSEASKAAQGAPTKVVTTNEAGDLAAHTAGDLGLATLADLSGLATTADLTGLQSQINGLAQRDKELADGIAVSMALAQPIFMPGQTFAMRAGYGNFDGSSALGVSAAGVLVRGHAGPTSSVVLDAGVGFAPGSNMAAGRAGITFGW